MVGFKSLGWPPEPYHRRISAEKMKKGSNLGILAFETAKAMSILVSLYKSLSNEEICRLRNTIIRSEGVAFLNSTDEEFLLRLAFAERLEHLDRAANSVSRLGKKCDDLGLNRFDLFYTDLKLGIVNLEKVEYGSKIVEKKVRKMEKSVSTTSCLHAALEGLTELEVSERKLKQLKTRQVELQKANFDIFNEKLENQRKEVRYFREISLWCKSIDKTAKLMARIVCVLYARICVVFKQEKNFYSFEPKENLIPHSAPLATKSKPTIVRFYSRKSLLFYDEEEKILHNNGVFHSAEQSTVGGSGLAMRYANVILLAEKYLDSTVSISHDERESLYQMLPENLKALVRTKLSKNMKCTEDDVSLADGWREAMVEMMGWIVPMANDTVTCQMERSFERMKFDSKPTVLLLQTLHFADKEKTEAAIAEILVGLSCIFRYENRILCE